MAITPNLIRLSQVASDRHILPSNIVSSDAVFSFLDIPPEPLRLPLIFTVVRFTRPVKPVKASYPDVKLKAWPVVRLVNVSEIDSLFMGEDDGDGQVYAYFGHGGEVVRRLMSKGDVLLLLNWKEACDSVADVDRPSGIISPSPPPLSSLLPLPPPPPLSWAWPDRLRQRSTRHRSCPGCAASVCR